VAINHFLAFDLGAESGRAILGSLESGKLTLDVKHRFSNPTSRVGGHLHWDVLSQWESLKAGLRKTAGSEASHKIELSGIGVDTWGVDFGLISEDGDLLGNPVHYRDSRTDGLMEKTFARVDRKTIFQATGIQFMQLNTLFQLLALQQQSPRMLSAAQTLLFMPDLFNYFFTGQRKGELSIASTSQMLDPRTGTWATSLLRDLQLPAQILPDLIPSGTVVGHLTDDVAHTCGVAPSVPVIAPGGHDTASAIAAVPAEDENAQDWCYISSGTWSLMGVELKAPLINETSLQFNYTNELGVSGRVRFLKNIMGLWLVQECRRQFARDGYDHSYTELTQMAERANPFTGLIDPDHGPFLSPDDMPGKIERFCQSTGQRVPNTRGEFVRTCLESLALTYRRTLEGLEKMLGRKIAVIHIVGGGCQNELLNQMTADACNRLVIAGPVEATAAGNLLVQAMAVGLIKSLGEARQIVRSSLETKRFEPRDAAKWESAYERFSNLPKI
jgi:sugar (pentulose or hexulose) kinase